MVDDPPLETPYVQITLDWMQRYGGLMLRGVKTIPGFTSRGGTTLSSGHVYHPADFSAVAFPPLVAATLSDSDLLLPSLDLGQSRR